MIAPEGDEQLVAAQGGRPGLGERPQSGGIREMFAVGNAPTRSSPPSPLRITASSRSALANRPRTSTACRCRV
ncbi:hypothetical protein [Frankia sp. EI5c]|uniref:hypothetical protein n=1 Tax=Frankia sp. EI5c TaxID=683316 RepID=UPI000825C1E7|nr:hypothetical protein [Frankia sp. EI5c]